MNLLLPIGPFGTVLWRPHQRYLLEKYLPKVPPVRCGTTTKMFQGLLSLFVAISFFLIITVPLSFVTRSIPKLYVYSACTLWLVLLSFTGLSAQAYPVFAQKAYESPREETGRIVCANCHLASKPVEFQMPQSILPGQVFVAEAQIPIAKETKQVLGNGKKGSLNVGGVFILPAKEEYIIEA